MQHTDDTDCYRLLTCAQMAEADRQTIASGLAAGSQLMDNAGYAILDVILKDFGQAPRVHVLCGTGNNGGDGYVVARLLAERGHPVSLYALGAPKKGTDADAAAARWTGPVLDFSFFEPGRSDLVVDAIFGAGGKGDLPEIVISALNKAKQPSVPVLAVDLPSGVDGDTGHIRYQMACDATVTFYRKKPGHVLEPGRSACGTIVVADIGVRGGTSENASNQRYENDPTLWRSAMPKLSQTTHKYQRGHVAVFSGPALATGAARLSAIAAQKVGIGAVTLLGTEAALHVQAAHLTSAMVHTYADPEDAIGVLAKLNNPRCVVLGPGFGDMNAARQIATSILRQEEQTLVLDADGLTAFVDESQALFGAAALHDEPRLILTPHEGEFGRLFPDIADDGSLSKIDRATKAAERAHAVVVYKGRDTVIAAPRDIRVGKPCVIVNGNASPALATAGSGDVLAGIIAGLCARGTPVFEAAAAAVWLHAEAGSKAGAFAIAEDIADRLPDTMSAVENQFLLEPIPRLQCD
ncbi:MAG: NAD(P)H-hydrate dehydratase [Pseudomonadota bacterium]